MDRFLIFFQQYIYTKQYIFMDLEFMLLDTFEGLRTKNFPKVDSLQQSNVACRRIRCTGVGRAVPASGGGGLEAPGATVKRAAILAIPGRPIHCHESGRPGGVQPTDRPSGT